LELSVGRIGSAIEMLEQARDLSDRHGLAEPNIVHWQADLVEAHVRAGNIDAAHDALASLEEQAQRTGGRWALGTAARCRGFLTDGSAADDWFDAALEQLEALASPFEVARTQLCRGESLRRARRRDDARCALRAALETFDRLGAKAWAARTRSELRAIGAKPRLRRDYRDRDVLTSQELQVALIVAGGASNREAAAALFLSPKTIEYHLGHIYRKLGVQTRTGLSVAAARRGWLDGTPVAVGREPEASRR
jgi:DNA-binding CsgD family transcriptional regulator